MYYLTPKGMEEKTRVTARFLRHKMAEFENLMAFGKRTAPQTSSE